MTSLSLALIMDRAEPPADADERFTALYREHRDQVLAWARRFVGSGVEAEDLAAETFTRAWRNFGRFRGEAAFSTWLYSILRNLVYDRREPVQAELEAERHETERAPTEALAESRFIGARIDEAIGRLSPQQRQVFLLREFEGLKHAEIARRLGISESTAKVHYFQALKRLREELHDLI